MICPNCNFEIFFCLDEWGYTPFHLHCKNCNINIGSKSRQHCIELFKEYHQPNTYLEYYKNNIQLLIINGKFLIDQE